MSYSIGDKTLVSFRGTLFGQRIINTFWYQLSLVTGTPDETAFNNAFHSVLNAPAGCIEKFLDCMPSQYLLNEVWIQKIESFRVVANKYLHSNPGTFSQDTATANLAACITRRGAAASRHNVSSLHLVYPSLDTGALSGSISPAWGTAATAFLPFVAQSYVVGSLGTMSPIINNGPGAIAVSPIVMAFLQTTLRVMRRRTLGLGE